MSHSQGKGRFGNQFIRNVAFNIIAEKHNLYTTYQNKEEVEKLGLLLYVGTNKYSEKSTLNDNNFISYLTKKAIDTNLHSDGYFQTHEISNEIFKYINQEKIMNQIINNNSYKERYKQNNDCFIHIRLGDVSKYNPGFYYYDKILQKISSYDNIFIGTDTINHRIIKKFLERYPNVTIMKSSIIDTILFGSTCKHVILSYGTFSATIGYLSFYSYVFCIKKCEKYAWDWRHGSKCDLFKGKSNIMGDWVICE
jgi:hypothetical protein